MSKEKQLKKTKKLVDASYKNWIEVKSKHVAKIQEVLSDAIYQSYELDAKSSEIDEKAQYWFEKFKDETMVLNKLKNGINKK